VNLEVFLNDDGAFDGAAVSSDLTQSVEYFHLPDWEPVHLVNWSLLDKHVAQLLAIISEAPRPVYIHCLDGIDRTNTLAAAYRVLIEGVSREEAVAEMARFRSPWLRFDAKYINSLQGERRAEILRNVTEWKSKLKPNATIACAHGKCAYATVSTRGATPSDRWRTSRDNANMRS
jgi:protein-tyrosine phosphatase